MAVTVAGGWLAGCMVSLLTSSKAGGHLSVAAARSPATEGRRPRVSLLASSEHHHHHHLLPTTSPPLANRQLPTTNFQTSTTPPVNRQPPTTPPANRQLQCVLSAFDERRLLVADNEAGRDLVAQAAAVPELAAQHEFVYVPDAVASNVLRIGGNVVAQRGFPATEAVLQALCDKHALRYARGCVCGGG